MVNNVPETKKDNVKLQDDLKIVLKTYYKRLFPHKQFYQWLKYGNCKLQSKLLLKSL